MASSELTSQIPALVCCYFLPTARCPAQMTPSHPLPIFGFRSCKSGGCRGRKEAEEISHKSPVCRCMHKAGSLQARAMAVCQSAEISGSREPRGQGRGVCFPFRNRKNKAPKNKNQKKTPRQASISQLVASRYFSRDSGEEAGRGKGGEKGTNLQLALQSGMQRMHKQPRSALLAAPSPALLAPKLAPGSWEQSSEGNRASQ